MSGVTKIILIAAGVVTIVAAGLWLATGRYPYTKFRERVVVEAPDQGSESMDDLLVESGFYDSEAQAKEARQEWVDVFRFGLIPVPQGLFDKHMLSVATFVLPAWLIAGAALLVEWRRRRRASSRAGPAEEGAATST